MAELSQPKVAIVIPARFGSTRLPGKPLSDICGKPMIQHVYERACLVPGVDAVVVATDDLRIQEKVQQFGGTCLMTSRDHASGTDRLVEVSGVVDADIYINLQGDEPLVEPDDISTLLNGLLDDISIEVATLCHSLSASEVENPNYVKVARTDAGDALYFSRSPIPYPRSSPESFQYLKHVGIYGYRREVLKRFSHLPRATVEEVEGLEQLRLLASGIRMRVFEVPPVGPGVDSPSCLARVRSIIQGGDSSSFEQNAYLNVKLIISDVDGVLTDGTLFYDSSGEFMKAFHVHDGLGISLLQKIGVSVAIVSGRDSEALRKRLEDLKINSFALGAKNKADACTKLMQDAGVEPGNTIFLGDDSIDLPAFEVCGFSAAVANAPSYIKQAANLVLSKEGGKGALREVADRILFARGRGANLSSARDYLKDSLSVIQ